ncbi:hypothetical protein Gotri_019617 [Gossypium trilobum]|uniref:Uncharacterized protein n=1 Tax=Gossypium trilobum TaxID=34281 RepID=A0A7J9EE86_9ROSI|nr:hypothetical protein [Gossypium trilobum]
MQTLDLRLDDVNIFEYIHVPNVICKMEQLRHLYLPEECNPKTKLKLGTLRNLQTLVNFNTKNCYVKDFMNMTNLRELEIRWPFNIEGFNTEELDKNPPIIQSEYLHSLSIINNIINDERRIDPKHLAHLLLSCKNISKFSLDVEIRRLPEYHYLSSNLAYIKLRSLIELNNLEEWKVGEGAMPSLQRLEIQSCIQLKKLPDGLRFIATLQEVKIGSMRKTFKDKVEEEEEDFCKVRHGLSIIFQDCEWYRSHCHFFYSAAALHAYHVKLCRWCREDDKDQSVYGHTDENEEQVLLRSMYRTVRLMEAYGLSGLAHSSYSDTSSTPGLYVLFWELKMKGSNDLPKLDAKVMEQCCCIVEESFDFTYKSLRKGGAISALELRVVKHGSFDELMDFYISKGASISQYKLPCCLKTEEAIKILNSGMVGKFFSPKTIS